MAAEAGLVSDGISRTLRRGNHGADEDERRERLIVERALRAACRQLNADIDPILCEDAAGLSQNRWF
jgi:hypothetical protein